MQCMFNNQEECSGCSAQVFEGHPFIVEAGVSLGGKDVKPVSAHSLSHTHSLGVYLSLSTVSLVR